MSFTTDIRTTTRKHVTKINEKNKEIADFNKKYRNYYTQDVFNQKQNELEKQKQDLITLAQGEILEIVTDYKAKIANIDVLDGEKVTPDIALLDGKRKLTQRDLESMFDRATGNRTMQRIIVDYSKDFNIQLDRTFYSADDKASGADILKQYAFNSFSRPEYADIMDSDEYFNKIIPDALKEE